MKNRTIEEMIDNCNITINTISRNNHNPGEHFNKGKTFDCDVIGVTKGAYEYKVDGKTYTAKAGEIFFIPAGCQFSGTALYKSEHYFCHFSIEIPVILKADNFYEEETVKMFFKTCSQSGNEFLLKCVIKIILYHLAIKSGITFLENVPYGIKKVIEEINKNPRSNITGADLAKIANMNYSYFSRRFREFIGVSPIKYRDNVRLEEAKRMILKGMSVKETAFELGFSDMFAFSKKFKKHFKISPSKLNSIDV